MSRVSEGGCAPLEGAKVDVWHCSKGQRNRLNSNDNIYQQELLPDLGQTSEGYAAVFDIGLQLD